MTLPLVHLGIVLHRTDSTHITVDKKGTMSAQRSSDSGNRNGPGQRSSTSPSTSYRSISQTPNIPLTLPRWGGPPPPPLPHHPHSSNSTWNRNRADSDTSGSGSGSISLAKITGPPSRTTSDFYKRETTTDPLDEYTHHGSGSSVTGNIGKISQYQSIYPQGQGQRVGGYEREVSEDPGSGSGKKRRRDSEKPSLEEMDDRWVQLRV